MTNTDRVEEDAEQLKQNLERLVLRVGELEQQLRLFDLLLGSVNTVLWAFDWHAQRVAYVSPAYERIFGYPAQQLLQDYSQWQSLIHPDDKQAADESFARVIEVGAIEKREYRIVRADGELRWISDRCFIARDGDNDSRQFIVGLAEDITEDRRLRDELHRLATTDTLTRSSNRGHFFACADREFKMARDHGAPMAMLMLDLDDFKLVNDRFGHLMGDDVLQRIAGLGLSCLRRGDLFGRTGGEEFAALLPRCTLEQAWMVAERLQTKIRATRFRQAGSEFAISASQGLTMLQPDDESIDDLYARADIAMYQAKQQGKNQIVVDARVD